MRRRTGHEASDEKYIFKWCTYSFTKPMKKREGFNLLAFSHWRKTSSVSAAIPPRLSGRTSPSIPQLPRQSQHAFHWKTPSSGKRILPHILSLPPFLCDGVSRMSLSSYANFKEKFKLVSLSWIFICILQNYSKIYRWAWVIKGILYNLVYSFFVVYFH